MMAPMTNSVEISRSPDDVFAYVTDVAHFDEWQEGLISARQEGENKVGSKVVMRRKAGPREQTLTAELTEFSPPRSWAFRGIDGPVRPIGRGTVEPIGDGSRSRLSFELDFEGHGIGKLLVPLFVRPSAKKELLKNHENLKQRLESGGATAAATATPSEGESV
jgi:uncharacterized protein YndB with AHSA1/START domain